MNFSNVLRPLLGLLATTLLLGMAQAQTRFSLSPDGQEVTDTTTGLNWQRCSAGQNWNGSTCAGSVVTYTFAQARAYANAQTGWRLPNVKELASLVDLGRNNPAIDPTAFPSTSSFPYWTSSALLGNGAYGWTVDFYYGVVSYDTAVSYRVRLVR